jgi:hypothetical protein
MYALWHTIMHDISTFSKIADDRGKQVIVPDKSWFRLALLQHGTLGR